MRAQLTAPVGAEGRARLVAAVREVVAEARAAGRDVLLESEGLAVASALGLGMPKHIVVPATGELPPLDDVPGESVVIKTLSPRIVHKSDVGAVCLVPRDDAETVLREMRERFADQELAGLLVEEHVRHRAAPGGELLLGLRATEDFGPVVTLGLGGVHAELLARQLTPGRDVAILSPALDHPDQVERALADVAAVDLAARSQRGKPPLLTPARLHELLRGWLMLAEVAAEEGLSDFEVNPLAVVDGDLIALDAVGSLGELKPHTARPRPLATVGRLLHPRSMAIVGVSERRNPGRQILENVLDAGFPAERLVVLKDGVKSVGGVRCVPGLDDLDEPVDVLVVSVAAAAAADITARALRRRHAASVILIPGGFDEHADGGAPTALVRAALEDAREQPDGGAVVNGSNCLGIRSLPGCYDTLFIPRHKLSAPGGHSAPLAVLSQSGALGVVWASRLGGLDPRYVITLGNQLDLTLADYLEHLANDPAVRVFACYVEGFKPGDGERFVRVASRLAQEGRPVVLYRAGRTAAGARASASHTASIAGDHRVCTALARSAGVLVADTLCDFSDLTRLLCLLDGRHVGGLRLGALSNAGFECVAMADRAGPFSLPEFGPDTHARVASLFAEAHLQGVVAVRNPLDVTPILDDEGFALAAGCVLDDPNLDVAIIGCVPLTGQLTTLPGDAAHHEDLTDPGSVVSRLIALNASSRRAWVAVVDAGELYDPMAAALEAGGVPTLRNADRALELFGRVCVWRRTFQAPSEPVVSRRALVH